MDASSWVHISNFHARLSSVLDYKMVYLVGFCEFRGYSFVFTLETWHVYLCHLYNHVYEVIYPTGGKNPRIGGKHRIPHFPTWSLFDYKVVYTPKTALTGYLRQKHDVFIKTNLYEPK